MIAKASKKGVWRAVALVAVLFGLVTLREGGMTLSGDEAAVEAAGNYVPFVLWFNFAAGFAYVVAGIGLWLQKHWAVWLAVAIAAATALTFAAFGAHIYSGGAYEKRTVVAMSLRTLVWVTIAAIAWRCGRVGVKSAVPDGAGASAGRS
jgi:hypothetical protein